MRDRQLSDELCDARRIDPILAERYSGSRSEVSWTLTRRCSARPDGGGLLLATSRCDDKHDDGDDEYSSRCDGGNALLLCCHVPLVLQSCELPKTCPNKYVGLLRSVLLFCEGTILPDLCKRVPCSWST